MYRDAVPQGELGVPPGRLRPGGDVPLQAGHEAVERAGLFPAWLRDAAQVLPVRPLAAAMQAAFDPRTNGGRQIAWPDLAIVAAWGVIGALYAVRKFSWAPSSQG